MVFTPRLRRTAKNVVVTSLWLIGRYRKALREIRKPIILKYHRTHASNDAMSSANGFFEFERGVSARHLEAQARLITRFRRPIGMDELSEALRLGKSLPERAVALTFDDGYIDNYEVAFPILRRHKIPATFYVCPGLIDSNLGFWWDEIYSCFRETKQVAIDISKLAAYGAISQNLKEDLLPMRTVAERESVAQRIIVMAKRLPVQRIHELIADLVDVLDVSKARSSPVSGLMGWPHINEMANNGMDIGSHTLTHPMMSQMSEQVLRQEVQDSRRRLQDELGRSVNGFVYPSGDYHAMARDVVRQAGHWYACTSESGFVTPSSDPYLLRRVNISDGNMALSCREIVMTYNRHAQDR
jgi:peptidoglycan/xylan/chitin deacetylase (PgdA/CDA1 family)